VDDPFDQLKQPLTGASSDFRDDREAESLAQLSGGISVQ
jgi:hypothetical protein